MVQSLKSLFMHVPGSYLDIESTGWGWTLANPAMNKVPIPVFNQQEWETCCIKSRLTSFKKTYDDDSRMTRSSVQVSASSDSRSGLISRLPGSLLCSQLVCWTYTHIRQLLLALHFAWAYLAIIVALLKFLCNSSGTAAFFKTQALGDIFKPPFSIMLLKEQTTLAENIYQLHGNSGRAEQSTDESLGSESQELRKGQVSRSEKCCMTLSVLSWLI